MRRHSRIAAVCLIVLGLVPHSNVFADAIGPSSEAGPAGTFDIEEWRKTTAAGVPPKAGCYQLEYPTKTWAEVDCGTPSSDTKKTNKPEKSDLSGPRVLSLSGDYIMTPSTSISSATGRIITVNTVTSVGSLNTNDGVIAAGLFSLQVNSNKDLPARSGNPSCATSGNTSCRGWIQFVYDNERALTIQYWFLHYLTDASQQCPTGMFKSNFDCGANARSATLPSTFPADVPGLQGASLTGQAFSNGTVSATLTVGRQSRSIVGTDAVGAFGSNWTSAEFNVFGAGTNSAGTFRTVHFNTEAQLTMGLTSDNDTSGKAPDCTTGSTTFENSNLFLGPCIATTTVPGIWFNESPNVPRIAGVQPATGTSLGGTTVHLAGGPFAGPMQVKFGAQIAEPPTVSTHDLRVVSPPSVASSVDVSAAFIFPNGRPGPFSAPDPALQFVYIKVPSCSFSESCPVFENQPPTYTASCNETSDFYDYPGLPADPDRPGGLMPVEMGVKVNSGLMSAEQLGLAACQAGTKTNCYLHSLELAQRSWCLAPAPPPPKCGQCGNEKCCPDPLGGVRHVCVPLNKACPPVQ